MVSSLVGCFDGRIINSVLDWSQSHRAYLILQATGNCVESKGLDRYGLDRIGLDQIGRLGVKMSNSQSGELFRAWDLYESIIHFNWKLHVELGAFLAEVAGKLSHV